MPDTVNGPTFNPDVEKQEAERAASIKANQSLNDATVNPNRKKAATKKLKNEMRNANKHETIFDMVLVGDLNYIAGICVDVDKTFGKFSGKYIFDKVCHKIARNGAGYTCSVLAHLCLVGY